MTDKRIGAALRALIEARAQGCCEYCYCLVSYSPQSFSIEHVMPRSRGGLTIAENLALSCQGCNNHKATKIDGYDPVSGEMVPLFHRRQQRWREHFTWADSCSLIRGITPTGRATVETLKLNRDGVVNLRQLLFEKGLHPPIVPGLA